MCVSFVFPLMPRLISTPRKRNARKVTYRSPDSPYQVKMRYGQIVHNYVHRFAHAIHSFHLNALEGNSDFNTPERQAQILIYYLPGTGPLERLELGTKMCMTMVFQTLGVTVVTRVVGFLLWDTWRGV